MEYRISNFFDLILESITKFQIIIIREDLIVILIYIQIFIKK